MNWIRKNIVNLILVACVVAGLGLLLYPSVANYWNSLHQTRAIAGYVESVSAISKEDYSKILEEAHEYNEELAETGMRWHLDEQEQAEYEKQLKVAGTDVMAYVSIPKFRIKVPVYHGTDEAVLQVAVGHLECSSLPVGGESTHTLISGHRGLPSAKLFSDIVRIKEGDIWTIRVLNETLTYECDQIRIVLPDDLTELQIEEGEDLCTLITCTPYGVNTHRLLVRGHRIPNVDGAADITADAIQVEPRYAALFLAIPVIIVLIVILMISTGKAARVSPEEIKSKYLKKKGMK